MSLDEQAFEIQQICHRNGIRINDVRKLTKILKTENPEHTTKSLPDDHAGDFYHHKGGKGLTTLPKAEVKK